MGERRKYKCENWRRIYLRRRRLWRRGSNNTGGQKPGLISTFIVDLPFVKDNFTFSTHIVFDDN